MPRRIDQLSTLSVVIPTLDAARRLPACLDAIAGRVGEIIIADGGSRDQTADIATSRGARLVAAAAGRGGQLRCGAAAARGDWLLFLHADTCLTPGWPEAAENFMQNEAGGRAAVFRFALDDGSRRARRLERMVAWRCRMFGLAYGDQGLLMSRAFYDELGGFRPLPLMEDVDLVRRIGRRRLVMLDADAVTSASRYRRGGYVMRSARNLACLGLYLAGLSPRVLVRLYG